MTRQFTGPHRRSDRGPILVYLDQSILSDLVREQSHADLLDLLRAHVQAGRVICPRSEVHALETSPAGLLAASIADLSDDLADGIVFRPFADLKLAEVISGVGAFLGETPSSERWTEAFSSNPSAPRASRYPGGLRISARFESHEAIIEDVRLDQALSLSLGDLWAEAHAVPISFRCRYAAELRAMVLWMLGPLLEDSAFLAREQATQQSILRDVDAGEGPEAWLRAAFRLADSMRPRQTAEYLRAKFPSMTKADWVEFAESKELHSLPSITLLPALLAAMAAASAQSPAARRAKPGDYHDLLHLTAGLGRCHVVTADASMAQLVTDYKLVPEGCRVIPTGRWKELASYLAGLESETPGETLT